MKYLFGGVLCASILAVALTDVPLVWAGKTSTVMEDVLRESDRECTGPVLELKAVSVPLRLCAMQASSDAPVEWLKSKIRPIRFMGITVLFECELDLEAGNTIKTLTPAMNAAVQQADNVAQKLVSEDYETVLRPLVEQWNARIDTKPEKRILLSTRADFHKKWELTGVFASFSVGTDGQLHSAFFVDWTSRIRVRPHDEHFQYDTLQMRFSNGVPDMVSW